MASRGVNFQFRVDDRVLCFEPDPKKAKVLYEAKILETHVGRDRSGARLPEYLIHFNGWSSSWDRRISEEHLLRLTPDNMALAKRLRDEARRIRSNNARKRKIDEILDQVFNRRKRRQLGRGAGRRQRGTAAADDNSESSSTSRSTSDSSADDDDDDGTLSADEDQSRTTAESSSADSQGSESGSNGRIESAADKTSTSSDDAGTASSSRGRRPRSGRSSRRRGQQQQQARAESNASGERSTCSRKVAANGNGEDEDEGANEAVVYSAPPESAPLLELPMPPNLRKILMTDCRQVHRKTAQPAALLAQPTVLTILERFLDHFAKHTAVLPPATAVELVASSSLSAKSPASASTARDPMPPCAETRMRLAEEVTEGVRVLFDCTLPLILLYAAERAQYEDIFVTCTTTVADATIADGRSFCPSPAKVGSDCEPDATAVVTATAPPLGRLTRPPISTNAAAATRCPMHLRGGHGGVGPGGEPRPQRHASHKSHASAAATAESSSRDLGSEPVRRTRAETSSHHHLASDTTAVPATAAQHHSSVAQQHSSVAVTDAIRSFGQHGSADLAATVLVSDLSHCEPSTCPLQSPPLPAGQPVLPEQYRTMQPPLPCSIYGLPHLLRLLLKLPDLVLRMQMTPEKSSSVQFVLQNLVRYLSEEAATLCLYSSPH